MFKIDLWELALQKLEEIPVPSNPPDDSKNGMAILIWKKMEKMVSRVQMKLNTA